MTSIYPNKPPKVQKRSKKQNIGVLYETTNKYNDLVFTGGIELSAGVFLDIYITRNRYKYSTTSPDWIIKKGEYRASGQSKKTAVQIRQTLSNKLLSYGTQKNIPYMPDEAPF